MCIRDRFFFIHTKDEEQKTDYKTVGECIRQIHNILTTFFPRDSKYIKPVSYTHLGIDPQTPMVLVCKKGKQAYLAQNRLKRDGYANTKVLEGGITFNPIEEE